MKPRILRIRLAAPAAIGRGAVVEKQVGFDSLIDNVRPVLSFDKDPRFLRVDFPGQAYFELIPLSNVASLMAEPTPASED